MEQLSHIATWLLTIIVFIAFWYIIRKILKSLSDKINNADIFREETVEILKEIREELKELNKKNSAK